MIAPVLSAALALAADGRACFFCRPDKAPACPGGFKAATADADELRALFARHPGPLLGVATGRASGFDVLDLDPRHGADAWLAEHRDLLPPTRTHRTRSDGLHVLFRHAPGLRNSAGKLAPGCDVRADGGYVIWWPATGLAVLSGGEPALWPAWLLARLRPPPVPIARPVPALAVAGGEKGRRYAVAALRRAVERIATAPEGRRNETLNAECFALARFAPGVLSAVEIAGALAAGAVAAGLAARETERTLASALRAGGVA